MSIMCDVKGSHYKGFPCVKGLHSITRAGNGQNTGEFKKCVDRPAQLCEACVRHGGNGKDGSDKA